MALLAACRKNVQSSPPPPETAGQKLVKIVKIVSHTNDSLQVLYRDSVEYTYDANGRITREGAATYTRDAKGRIILMEGVSYEDQVPLDTLEVYNRDETSTQVAYKIERMRYVFLDKQHTSTDSLVYYHDEKGRVQQIVWWETDDGGPWYKWNYQNYTYDVNGRLTEIIRRLVIPNQPDRTSRFYMFNTYDSLTNAIPQGDEARSDVTLWGTDNVSANNITTEKYYAHGAIFNVEKAYNYRADGRPRNGTVTINGVTALKYEYYYE